LQKSSLKLLDWEWLLIDMKVGCVTEDIRLNLISWDLDVRAYCEKYDSILFTGAVILLQR
jgi:hypothetical protein